MNIILFIIGLLLILGGANFMTDGASALARRMGMSDFMVGLTVVSMMLTRAPELVVSLTSAFNASSAMAVGNIVGSNIFNILVIVGISALIKPIRIEGGILVNEIPLVILSSAALLAIGCAPWLDGTSMEVTRVDGILLFLFFLVFMRFTFAQAKKAPDPVVAEDSVQKKSLPLWKALIYVCGGLAGLTFIAAGTSLPELATSVVAALKGSPGICIGNVIGSNIFNIFFVLGVTSIVKPLPFGGIDIFDLSVLMVASLLFWAVGWFVGNRTIRRSEGAVMMLIYIAYVTTLCLTV